MRMGGLFPSILALGLMGGMADAAQGTISWYGVEACRVNRHPGCPTASGRSLHRLIQQHVPYCATRKHTFGTWLTVSGSNGSAKCQVWDRGPARTLGRMVDVAPGVFEEVCGSLTTQ